MPIHQTTSAVYRAKQILGRCQWVGCELLAVESTFCAGHHVQRLSKARDKRAERRAKGTCTYCDTPPTPGYATCAHHRRQRGQWYPKTGTQSCSKCGNKGHNRRSCK